MPLIIKIKTDATGQLTVDPPNDPTSGHPDPTRNQTVQAGDNVYWDADDPNIEYIRIEFKAIHDSQPIFVPGDPQQDPNRTEAERPKHWKGTVKRGVNDFSVYVYTIHWKRVGVETEGPPYDPIIAIRPSLDGFFEKLVSQNNLFQKILFSLGGLLMGGFASFMFWRKERIRLKNEIRKLEREN